jgi:hypothetical protein
MISSTRKVPTIASADDQREAGGDDAAEHEHHQQQRDREGDELRSQEVLFHLLVHLPEDFAEASDAHRDLRVVARVPRRELPGSVQNLVLVPTQRGEHERLAAVLAAERGRAPGAPVRDGAGHRLSAASRVATASARPDVRIVDRSAGRHEQYEVGLLLPEVALDRVRSPGGFRRRIVEATAAQAGCDAATQHRGGDEEHHRADDHRLAVGDGETTEASEQDRAPNRVCYR